MAVVTWWAGLALWAQVALMLGAALLCAIAAVRILRIDERTDRTVDAEYRLLFPTTDSAASVVKAVVRYVAVSGVLSLVAAAAAHLVRPLGAGLFVAGTVRLTEPYADLMLGSMAVIAPMALAADALRATRRPLYGMFVSYRSHDAAFAREIADLMIASGIRVWFAEYEILLVGREHFQRAIDTGIRESGAAIAVTSEEYFGSTYCDREMSRLSARLDPGRLLEVRARAVPAGLRSRSPVPEEALVPYSVSAVLEQVDKLTGVRTVRSERSSAIRSVTIGECMGRPFSVDVGDWERIESDGPLPSFRFGADPPVLMNVAWGPEIAPEARMRETDDDRVMYDELMRYAAGYMERLQGKIRATGRGAGRTRVVGVHLLFCGGYSQLALTYHNGMFWSRKVSIVLRNPVTSEIAEFAFTFGCPRPYPEYLRHTAEMDRVATSLRWE